MTVFLVRELTINQHRMNQLSFISSKSDVVLKKDSEISIIVAIKFSVEQRQPF
jgi:hypothetical protein